MGLFDEILKRRGYEPVAEVILIPETDGVIPLVVWEQPNKKSRSKKKRGVR